MINKHKKLLTLVLALLFFAGSSYAQDIYAPVYPHEPLKAKNLKDPVSALLEIPFRLVRWPIDQSLVYIGKRHIDKKAFHIYDKIKGYGVTPHIAFTDSAILPLVGLELDLMTMTRKKVEHPDVVANASVRYAMHNLFIVDSKVGVNRIAGTGLYTFGNFNFDHRSREPFYGIGPRTSLGDSSSIRMETVYLAWNAGYEFSPSLNVLGTFAFKENQIKHRAHDGKGDMTEVFAGQDIPGIHGGEELNWKMELVRDTRNTKDEASKGSYQKLSVKLTEGVDSTKARFLTYQLDAAKYFSLKSPRRVLAIRAFGEHNDEINHGTIPFYDMARLGGMGSSQRTSVAHRAFVYNRFYGESAILFSLEYRYAIWEYRDFRLNASVFWDEGQVFNEFNKFKFSDFRESYGLGFYLSYAKHTLLNFTVAHGDEGTRVYVKNRVPF